MTAVKNTPDTRVFYAKAVYPLNACQQRQQQGDTNLHSTEIGIPTTTPETTLPLNSTSASPLQAGSQLMSSTGEQVNVVNAGIAAVGVAAVAAVGIGAIIIPPSIPSLPQGQVQELLIADTNN